MTDQSPASDCDVCIIGGGPGGATAAIYAARAGLSVTVLEKETFPRYHIGESLTGVAGDILRDIGLGDAMSELRFPVKSGVKVMGRNGNEYFVPVLAETWQVKRDDFDKLLLEHARQAGATVIQGHARKVVTRGKQVEGVVFQDELTGTTRTIRCRVLIDASGTACFLSRQGIAGDRQFDLFGDQIAAFSQVEGAIRDPGEMGDNTFIFYSKTYHWAWFIPLSPEVVSIGVVVPTAVFHELGKNRDKVFSWGLEAIHPDLTQRVQGKPLVEPVRAIKDYSYRIEPFAGPGWFCIGDAHRFADPIFSFGVSSSMQEAKAVVSAIGEVLQTGDWDGVAQRYKKHSDTGQDAIFDFIRYFWSYPGFFGLQMRGKFRKEVIRLFGGDIFVPNRIVDEIRALMDQAEAPAPAP
jgi:FADH2-dependent halogenase